MRTQLPVQSREDLLRYQRIAMERRAKYAQAKSQLKRGERTLESVLDDPDLERMRALDAIAAMPHMGKARAIKVLDGLGIARNRRLRGIGCRQKAALLERFGGGR